MSCCMVFTFIACDCNGNNDDPNQTGGKNNPEKNIGTYEVTDKYMVNNGKTVYQIIIPKDAGEDLLSATDELKLFFSEATNIELPVSYEIQTGVKYISLGNSKLFKSYGLSVNYSDYGEQGYSIKTIDENVIIYGAKDLGVLYGVYKFLEITLNYDYYFTDVYSLDKVSNLKLNNFDITDKPDIENRIANQGFLYYNRTNQKRMKVVTYDNSFFYTGRDGGSYHNCFGWINPDDYLLSNPEFFDNDSDPKQLCYTAHGNTESLKLMKEIVVETMFGDFQNDKTHYQTVFALNDDWVTKNCTCSACESDNAKYGTYSSSVILFMNDIAEMMETKLREAGDERADYFTISFYAYFNFAPAPVKVTNENGNLFFSYENEMKLNKHVCPLVALINMDYTKSMYSKENRANYENVFAWKELSQNALQIWSYDAYFSDGGWMQPYNSFNVLSDFYRFCKEAGVNWLFPQGNMRNTSPTAFYALKGYIEAKLGWDTTANIETLIVKYFNAMFGSKSEEMKNLFDEERVLLNKQLDDGMASTTGSTGRFVNKNHWPKNILKNWIDRMSDMNEELILNGETVSASHIRNEMLSFLYIIVRLYSEEMSESELIKYKNLIKEYFTEFSISWTSEVETAESYLKSLGVE